MRRKETNGVKNPSAVSVLSVYEKGTLAFS